MQLLAGRRVCPDEAPRRCAAALRATARTAQRCRPARGRVRHTGAAAGGQLSTGVLASCVGEHGTQSGAGDQAGRTAVSVMKGGRLDEAVSYWYLTDPAPGRQGDNVTLTNPFRA